MRDIPKSAKIHPAAKNVVAGKKLPYDILRRFPILYVVIEQNIISLFLSKL